MERRTGSGAVRRSGVLLACLLLATACAGRSEARRTAAARDPERAVERALEQARQERGLESPDTSSSPAVADVDPEPERVVRGRDALDIAPLAQPVSLDDVRVVERLPAGLARTDEWDTTVSSSSGELQVRTVTFDAEDPSERAVGLDIRIVVGEPRAVAEARQRSLAERSAVDVAHIRGREAVVYPTGPATRTLRWIAEDGARLVLDGMGLSSAALVEIGRSIRPASASGPAGG